MFAISSKESAGTKIPQREKGTAVKHGRDFAIELKRQIVEELLSGVSTPAQLIRCYEISSGLRYYGKEQYTKGRFNVITRATAPSPIIS